MIFYRMYTAHYVYPFIWWIHMGSTFWLLWMMLLWTWICIKCSLRWKVIFLFWYMLLPYIFGVCHGLSTLLPWDYCRNYNATWSFLSNPGQFFSLTCPAVCHCYACHWHSAYDTMKTLIKQVNEWMNACMHIVKLSWREMNVIFAHKMVWDL